MKISWLVLLAFINTMLYPYEIEVINSTNVDIAMRPVTARGCMSEPDEVIRPGETKTPWHIGCGNTSWHIDISDEWDANKSWIGTARGKNRSWGYSYQDTDMHMEGMDHKAPITIIFVWDESLNAPRPYVRTKEIKETHYIRRPYQVRHLVKYTNHTIELR